MRCVLVIPSVILTLIVAGTTSYGQSVVSFECQSQGALPALNGSPDCAGCTSNGFALGQTGNPGTGVDATPSCAMPASGTQYLRIVANGGDPSANPPTAATLVPFYGPYPRPSAATNTEVRIAVPQGTTYVTLRWNWFNTEGSLSAYNDGFDAAVVDAYGATLAHLAYADTASFSGSCVDVVSGAIDIRPLGLKTAAVALALPSPVGAYLSLVAWNGGDNFYPSAAVVDDVTFSASPPWQVNQAQATMLVDGLTGSGARLAIDHRYVSGCAPTLVFATFTSTNIGLPWDVAVTAAPPVAPGLGGFITAGGQIVNVDLGDPSLVFLNGGSFTVPPGLPFANLTLPVTLTTPIALTGQLAVVDPATPGYVRLSQPNRLAAENGLDAPGPVSDDQVIAVSLPLASSPCGGPSAIPFYGTMYTSFYVSSNGRVMFGGASSSPSPTVAQLMSDAPSVGIWADFDPSAGGRITVVAAAPTSIRVEWNGVPYHGQTGTDASTFAIAFDTQNGWVTLDHLDTLAYDPAQTLLIGISAGLTGATDPGPRAFAPGGGSSPPSSLGMIYQAGPTNLVSGLTSLAFAPLLTVPPFANGFYYWAGY